MKYCDNVIENFKLGLVSFCWPPYWLLFVGEEKLFLYLLEFLPDGLQIKLTKEISRGRGPTIITNIYVHGSSMKRRKTQRNGYYPEIHTVLTKERKD